jgi:hypothetical protein
MKRVLIALPLITMFSIGSIHISVSRQQSVEPRPGKPVVIPTRYAEHRFIATPVTLDNVTLSLFTDSAGALFLYEDTVGQLRLSPETLKGASDDGRDLTVVALPRFKPEAAIPPPLGGNYEGRVFVFPRRENAPQNSMSRTDGMLGQQWFAGRVWTFDYPNQTLLWRAPGDLPAHDKSQEVKLAFKARASGKRANNFARIPIEVDGETIDFLLDTGATNVLSEDALKQIGDGRPAERAASFLVRSVFEKWHKRHPDWRALENVKTLTGSAMIEVPSITIGGFKVGPVWFTVQSDVGFQSVMGPLMDRRVDGAIGGSALHYLRMTVDWPNALAVFERP